MRILVLNTILGASLVLTLGGCKKSERENRGGQRETTAPNAEQKLTAIASFHWLGSKQISKDTNSAFIFKLMGRTESAQVTDQLLDKLAAAPWSSVHATNYSIFVRSNEHSAVLRSALQYLFAEECHFDLIESADGSPGFRFLVRLPNDGNRMSISNNLLHALAFLCGRTAPNAKSANTLYVESDSPLSAILDSSMRELQITASGDWWGVMAGVEAAGFGELSTQPQGSWLTGFLDLDELCLNVFSRTNSTGIKNVRLSVSGEGQDVRVRARVLLSQVLSAPEPWNIPTNLIHEPMGSLTAVRNAKALTSMLVKATRIPLSTAPDQFFFWSREGMPFQTYLAIPSKQGKEDLARIEVDSLPTANAWLATNGAGQLRFTKESNMLVWENAPFMKPYVRNTAVADENFLFGGLFPPGDIRTNPPPYELLNELKEGTGLLAYDWELTGLRADQLIQVSQLLRIAFLRPQIPLDSPSLLWIKASAPHLGNTVTTLEIAGTNEVILSRRGPIGVTGGELHLLIDWLEGPRFPFGYHTKDAPQLDYMRFRSGPPAIR